MREELNEAIGMIDDRYLTFTEKTKEEIFEMSKNQRSIVSVRSIVRTMLIAAVLVSVLTLTAFASGFFTLKDRPAEKEETYTIHWVEGESGSLTWKDLKYVFQFEGPDEAREIRFRPGWLPFEPNDRINRWSRDEDGFYSRLVSEGAEGVDGMSDNYQPYCVEVYYAPQFYDGGAMLLMYQTPETILEEQWGDLQILKFQAVQDFPANEYREAWHNDYYFVMLFDHSKGWCIVVSGTSDMDTIEHIARELEVKETGNVFRSTDFENRSTFIDVGQG